MANAYYATQTQRTLNTGELPMLSHGLESYRAYQWEVEIDLPTGMHEGEKLTLAAKQVSQIGFASEDIVADRVNDKFHYPGKVTPESCTITFDKMSQPNFTNGCKTPTILLRVLLLPSSFKGMEGSRLTLGFTSWTMQCFLSSMFTSTEHTLSLGNLQSLTTPLTNSTPSK